MCSRPGSKLLKEIGDQILIRILNSVSAKERIYDTKNPSHGILPTYE